MSSRKVKNTTASFLCKELTEFFFFSFSLDKCKGNWNFIPSKESIQYTMHRLVAASLVLDKVTKGNVIMYYIILKLTYSR